MDRVEECGKPGRGNLQPAQQAPLQTDNTQIQEQNQGIIQNVNNNQLPYKPNVSDQPPTAPENTNNRIETTLGIKKNSLTKLMYIGLISMVLAIALVVFRILKQ